MSGSYGILINGLLRCIHGHRSGESGFLCWMSVIMSSWRNNMSVYRLAANYLRHGSCKFITRCFGHWSAPIGMSLPNG